MDVTWDGQVLDALCLGYNVAYGARSIKYEGNFIDLVICIAIHLSMVLWIFSGTERSESP